MSVRRSIPTPESFAQLKGDDATQLDILTRAVNQMGDEVVLGCHWSLHAYEGPATGERRPVCTRCSLRAAHLVHHPTLRLVREPLQAREQDGAA